jgi:hypothetical protein
MAIDPMIWTILLWLAFAVCLAALVLSIFRVAFSLPGWLVWAILSLLCFLLLLGLR